MVPFVLDVVFLFQSQVIMLATVTMLMESGKHRSSKVGESAIKPF